MLPRAQVGRAVCHPAASKRRPGFPGLANRSSILPSSQLHTNTLPSIPTDANLLPSGLEARPAMSSMFRRNGLIFGTGLAAEMNSTDLVAKKAKGLIWMPNQRHYVRGHVSCYGWFARPGKSQAIRLWPVACCAERGRRDVSSTSLRCEGSALQSRTRPLSEPVSVRIRSEFRPGQNGTRLVTADGDFLNPCIRIFPELDRAIDRCTHPR